MLQITFVNKSLTMEYMVVVVVMVVEVVVTLLFPTNLAQKPKKKKTFKGKGLHVKDSSLRKGKKKLMLVILT
jgi:hypothetical protein